MIKLKAEQWQPLTVDIESNAYQKALSNELIRTNSDQATEHRKIKSAECSAVGLFENGNICIRTDMGISFIQPAITIY